MSKITAEHLGRAACVYIRQSSPGQLQNNHESRRRQYALADQAKARAFAQVIIIDDDLGRSGDGIARPGFERLLALVCEGRVGAVFAIEASRLARNGRDWHTLIDLCGLVGALLVDEVGEYDPRHPNDRLMLGMKGTFSEMELSLLRQRAIEAIWLKAARGEHFSLIAVGYVRTPSGRLDKDPDLRVREAVALVFRKFDELQSARQVLLWLRQESIELPTMGYAAEGRRITWKRPTYTRVQHVLTNPVYCGAYVFGRTTTEVGVKDGRKSTRKVRRSKQDWRVCIWDHHEGYISRNAFERNQQRLTENTNMWGESVRGAIRRGESLLAGLLRCGHCGRKLNVAYTGTGVTYARYICRGEVDTGETNPCISFGGWRVDQAVATELLKVISPLGVQAALQAIDACNSQGDDKQRHIELALEQARFEAKHARRQYHAVDPDNRLVAAELERRWNECLEAVCRLETDLSNAHHSAPSPLSQRSAKAFSHWEPTCHGPGIIRRQAPRRASASCARYSRRFSCACKTDRFRWFCIGKAATTPPSPCPRTRPENIVGGPTSTPYGLSPHWRDKCPTTALPRCSTASQSVRLRDSRGQRQGSGDFDAIAGSRCIATASVRNAASSISTRQPRNWA